LVAKNIGQEEHFQSNLVSSVPSECIDREDSLIDMREELLYNEG